MPVIPVDRQVVILQATVTFNYEAEVFPGDPDDMYEIANLEKPILENTLDGIIDSLGGFETKLTLTPLIEDSVTKK